MSQAIARTVAIIGGHGNVALHLAKLISSKHKVISVIRTPDHSSDITAAGAKPVVMSLESDPKETFTKLFENESAEVVVFSAGAGGKGAEERTKAVDYEGAVKIFDAIDGVDESKRPRLILVSAVDIRDPNIIPDYYVRKTLSSPNASITMTLFDLRPMKTKLSLNAYARLYQLTCTGSTKPIRYSPSVLPSNGLYFAQEVSITTRALARSALGEHT